MNDLDVSILVVGFNSSRYLQDCFCSIEEATTCHSYELLFTNNGADGSEEFVKERFPSTQILPSRGNVGFAAGNNYLASNAQGRWLLLLNPDTKLYPGAVDKLLEAANQFPDFSVFGGMAVHRDGSYISSSELKIPDISFLLKGLLGLAGGRSHQVKGEVVEVEAMNGGFMMVRRDVWGELGGMDPEFFLYAEEVDFFKRLRDSGRRAAQVRDSLVYHDFGSGSKFSESRMRFLTTGSAHFYRKSYPQLYASACVGILWLTMLSRVIAARLFGSRKPELAEKARAIRPLVMNPSSWIYGYRSKGADPRKA